jgi:hypothetical protein
MTLAARALQCKAAGPADLPVPLRPLFDNRIREIT